LVSHGSVPGPTEFLDLAAYSVLATDPGHVQFERGRSSAHVRGAHVPILVNLVQTPLDPIQKLSGSGEIAGGIPVGLSSSKISLHGFRRPKFRERGFWISPSGGISCDQCAEKGLIEPPRHRTVCFFVLCKRHWINRVPGAHQGDSP